MSLTPEVADIDQVVRPINSSNTLQSTEAEPSVMSETIPDIQIIVDDDESFENAQTGEEEQEDSFVPIFTLETPEASEEEVDFNDYSNSKIRSKTLNHLTTYRGIQSIAAAVPFLEKWIHNSQESMPKTLKTVVKVFDVNIDIVLGSLDHCIPCRCRVRPICQLTKKQRELKKQCLKSSKTFLIIFGILGALLAIIGAAIAAFFKFSDESH
ncbi:hypothetical protein DASC09_046070 [Saccharomycopsis crataegensis]|uniref:Uncharacterized protein n=1 Tax=Saccharomycopsis crataegensis TaxID=43959 RepID=A0AAV5QS96_9ASCO|nr:hypothetical protein DASC09_046070 [Saccharomycopsis crataegensis]